MKIENQIKLAELKLSRLRSIMYFAAWPFIAVLSLFIGFGLQDKINFIVALVSVAYLILFYYIALKSFAKDTGKLVKRLEEKK